MSGCSGTRFGTVCALQCDYRFEETSVGVCGPEGVWWFGRVKDMNALSSALASASGSEAPSDYFPIFDTLEFRDGTSGLSASAYLVPYLTESDKILIRRDPCAPLTPGVGQTMRCTGTLAGDICVFDCEPQYNYTTTTTVAICAPDGWRWGVDVADVEAAHAAVADAPAFCEHIPVFDTLAFAEDKRGYDGTVTREAFVCGEDCVIWGEIVEYGRAHELYSCLYCDSNRSKVYWSKGNSPECTSFRCAMDGEVAIQSGGFSHSHPKRLDTFEGGELCV